tara:strand:- start:91 stop:288 length:198 start_codon:yes stop_codon:yes gene_type:complete
MVTDSREHAVGEGVGVGVGIEGSQVGVGVGVKVGGGESEHQPDGVQPTKIIPDVDMFLVLRSLAV